MPPSFSPAAIHPSSLFTTGQRPLSFIIMKFNWGVGIAIFYSLFVVVMVGMVVYSKNFDHSLVVDNYYEEDLQYQKHIDKVNNSRKLATDLVIENNKEQQAILFQFPKETAQLGGNILFYRADDKSKDFNVKIAPGADGKIAVPVKDMKPGRWQLKVDWEGNGTSYYKEQTIFI